MDGVPARFLIPVVNRCSTAQRDEVGPLARSLEPDLAGIAQQVGPSPPITHHTAILTAQHDYSIPFAAPVERRRRQHRIV